MKRARAIAILSAFSFSTNSPADLQSDTPAPRIEPALSILPANHLKFYLHFFQPMERGEAFGHLRLVEINSSGKEIGALHEPFREVELWDETFTRLTLWLHPGRQKPGVNLNVEMGPVLEEGKRYRLEVSRNWRVEEGRPLGWLMVHEFLAGPSDETQPDPKRWKVEAKEGLVTVTTDEALDPESLRKRVAVMQDEEAAAVSIEANAEGFTIRPDEIMVAGRWRLVIDPRLEDLAGNSIARPFNLNLDQGKGVERTEAVEIVFDVPSTP